MIRTVEDARVTVVVMSRNRRAALLDSLARHRAPVILVDNGSDDGTVQAVREVFPDVEVVALGGNIGAAARTEGARRAATPFVAFADDDSWWAPGSLRRAADVLAASPQVAVAHARVLLGEEERIDPFDRVLARSPLSPVGGRASLLGFMACGSMVRRDAFLDVGGFDPIVRFPGEEQRVALDLVGAGWSLVHVPEALVHHHPSPMRDAPEVRAAAVTRSQVLTAVLRLPWSDVLRVGARACRRPEGRSGLRAALRDLPAAARERRVAPARALRAWETVRRAG
ncbi:glycosyltransferase family 2 protein [Cellulomonas fengjieae]|uniref:Glycosyltransferase n=1 Tax=Cellulomonas fengjieae TaxID=2819978 RepID=A0ABS3SIT3_9CELL|nr:glycosyltransferase [Cellulomonas fengjieae]MBO3085658.1 glycosyltransferase [Cellulomonas fengjieae]QVI67627.1 glycosyltransferase [Cellulomonas fengjieae]